MPSLPRSEWPILILASVQIGMAMTSITAPFRRDDWAPTWPNLFFLLLGLALLAFGLRNVRRLRPALDRLRAERSR